jgi:outer membrane protein OmpA-like peptidoglycan-associated protein
MLVAALLVSLPGLVQAQENPLSRATAAELVDRLTPAEQVPRLRGLTISQRATKPAQVDLAIEFAFGSAEITNGARDLLSELAKAMQADALREFRFRLAGHTDAVGSAAYNRALSEDRARAVQRFLSDEFSIDVSRLEIEGYGMTRLLFPNQPEDGRNRRVEIITLD